MESIQEEILKSRLAIVQLENEMLQETVKYNELKIALLQLREDLKSKD